MWPASFHEPYSERRADRQPVKCALERAAIRQYCQPERQEQRLRDSRLAGQPLPGPERYGASGHRHGAAPVALAPVAGRLARDETKTHRSQEAACDCPPTGHERLQHPAHGCTGEPEASPYADDRMSAQDLTERQREPLSGRVHRAVRRHLVDVKRLEMNAQRVRRIGEPAACESVGRKKVAELVMNFRLGPGNRQRYEGAKHTGNQSDQHHVHGRPPAQAVEQTALTASSFFPATQENGE